MVGGARAGALGTNRLLIFSLSGKETLTPKPAAASAPLAPPSEKQSYGSTIKGSADYFAYCSRCHGIGAVSGGLTPDLRHSALLRSDAWYNVVLDGTMTQGGMAGFKPVLSREQASAIRAYVIAEAQKALRATQAPKSTPKSANAVGL